LAELSRSDKVISGNSSVNGVAVIYIMSQHAGHQYNANAAGINRIALSHPELYQDLAKSIFLFSKGAK